MRLRRVMYRLLGQWDFRLAGPLHRAPRQSIGIVMLHGLHSRDQAREAAGRPPTSSLLVDDVMVNLCALSPAYEIISLDEAVDMLDGARKWRGNCIVLTFDDSLKCMATVATPALVAKGIPATFFVSTAAIDQGEAYWWLRLDFAMTTTTRLPVQVSLPGGRVLSVTGTTRRTGLAAMKSALRRLNGAAREEFLVAWESVLGSSLKQAGDAYPFAEVLSWDEVRAMEDAGMTIGSHTVTHPNLADLSEASIRTELADSRKRIEAECRGSCHHLCYPSGLYSESVPGLARECGYRSAVTTRSPGWNRPGGDPYALNRFAMPPHPYQLPFLLSGCGALKARLGTREASSP